MGRLMIAMRNSLRIVKIVMGTELETMLKPEGEIKFCVPDHESQMTLN